MSERLLSTKQLIHPEKQLEFIIPSFQKKKMKKQEKISQEKESRRQEYLAYLDKFENIRKQSDEMQNIIRLDKNNRSLPLKMKLAILSTRKTTTQFHDVLGLCFDLIKTFTDDNLEDIEKQKEDTELYNFDYNEHDSYYDDNYYLSE